MVALPNEGNEGAEATVRDVADEYNRTIRGYTSKAAMDEMMDYVTGKISLSEILHGDDGRAAD